MTSFKEEALISIIVPVYQVKKYIGECIESLIRQSYRKLEILLIDGGSTDGTGEICDEYAAKDTRIHVVHQETLGVSCARNVGMKLSKGAYIAFVDSDDVIADTYVEKLYGLIREYGADIAVCDYEKSKTGVLKASDHKIKKYCISAEEMLQEWHGRRKGLETVVWNKLYRREVLLGEHQIVFPEGKVHEDTCVSHLMVYNAAKVAITEEKLYLYRVRQGSITNSGIREEKLLQNIEAQLKRLSFFEEKQLQGSFERLAIGFLLHLVMFEYKIKRNPDISAECRQYMKELFAEYYPRVKRSKELKLLYRMILFLNAGKCKRVSC